MTPAEAVAYAIDHCSDKLSVIPERELVRVALLHGLGNVTLEQVEAELPRQGVFSEVIDGRVMATTDKLQAEENAIVKFAAAGQRHGRAGRRARGADPQAGGRQVAQ